jgi:hypothetical protein
MTTDDEREQRRRARRLQREIARLGCHPIGDPSFLNGVATTVARSSSKALGSALPAPRSSRTAL